LFERRHDFAVLEEDSKIRVLDFWTDFQDRPPMPNLLENCVVDSTSARAKDKVHLIIL
jgi:hypothetical protein